MDLENNNFNVVQGLFQMKRLRVVKFSCENFVSHSRQYYLRIAWYNIESETWLFEHLMIYDFFTWLKN